MVRLVLSFGRYSLDRHTDLDRIFNIYSGNGSIFVSKTLDREAAPWHNLTVVATEISKLYVYYKVSLKGRGGNDMSKAGLLCMHYYLQHMTLYPATKCVFHYFCLHMTPQCNYIYMFL